MLLTATRRAIAPAADLFGGFDRLTRFMPACDILEDKDNLRIVLELPGVRPEDVKINLENNVLTIRGEKRQSTEENGERWHRFERSWGSFERSFTLPNLVDAEGIQATAEHGVLTLVVPKSEKAKPREIPVRIG